MRKSDQLFGSYDARKLSSAGGSHWSDSSLSGRVSFILDGLKKDDKLQISNNSLSKMTIHNLREVDGGVYRYAMCYCDANLLCSLYLVGAG